ncbi:MAG: methionine biosynthesis protein MetW [Rickettsiaceae bacterium]|jgi:methionine biosynthesis protein MetW|nr:methionine biosynthesis protein MetW [Rickettsiaceae bacterium]
MQDQQLIGSAIKRTNIRFDLKIIADLIEENSKVLDIGCGSGELLQYLKTNKNVDGRGLEILQSDVSKALSKGISVMQGNADNDLAYYPDDSFDYAILSQTLQATKNPQEIVVQMLRIAKFAIISFPNFAHYKNRFYLFAKGKMPVSETIPYRWYDTPNIHFCSIRDFRELCAKMKFTIKKSIYLTNDRKLGRFMGSEITANFFAEYGLFLISKNEINLATQHQIITDKKSDLLISSGNRPAFANSQNSYQ